MFMLVGRALLFGKQHWVKGGHQIEVLNLIHKQTDNRLGTLEVQFTFHPAFHYMHSGFSIRS